MKYRKNSIDIPGQTFGRLTALERDVSRTEKNTYWLCKCQCERVVSVRLDHLRSGATLSCGCLRPKPHGLRRNRVYGVWAGIIRRCTNPHEKSYSNYGGRGISVHDDWRRDFASFYRYVIDLPNFDQEGVSIDRIDNDGNYEPGNVRWVTKKEQARNARFNHMITYQNKTQCVLDWSRELGLNRDTIPERLKRGWSVEKALTTLGRKTVVR